MDVKSDTAKIRYQVKDFSFVWMRRCNPLGSVNSLLSQASLLSGANPVSLFTLLLVFTPPAPQQSPWRGGVQVAYSSLGSLHSYFSSVQFRGSVVSDSLLPHGLQHARPPCPSPTSRVYSNSCSSSRWCHPTISSSAVSSPPAPNPSQHQDLFQWVSSLHEVAKVLEFSASTSVFPMSIQDWDALGWTGWISLQSKGLSRVFSNTTLQKHQFFSAQLSSQSNSHNHTWPLEKP